MGKDFGKGYCVGEPSAMMKTEAAVISHSSESYKLKKKDTSQEQCTGRETKERSPPNYSWRSGVSNKEYSLEHLTRGAES